MRLNETEAHRRFVTGRVARLATFGASGAPHLVPVTFAVRGTRLAIAVDHKAKGTRELVRIRNIENNLQVTLLVDHYEEDWTRLWWVRVDGTARVLRKPLDIAEPIDWLVAKYPQYQQIRPGGPVILVEAARWSGWAA